MWSWHSTLSMVCNCHCDVLSLCAFVCVCTLRWPAVLLCWIYAALLMVSPLKHILPAFQLLHWDLNQLHGLVANSKCPFQNALISEYYCCFSHSTFSYSFFLWHNNVVLMRLFTPPLLKMSNLHAALRYKPITWASLIWVWVSVYIQCKRCVCVCVSFNSGSSHALCYVMTNDQCMSFACAYVYMSKDEMNREGIAECGRGNQHNQLINRILILHCYCSVLTGRVGIR